MLKIYCQVRKSAALIKGSETVNFCLNAVNFRLVRQGEQGNNEKKFQGCISKGEGRASVDLPVMFFRASCITTLYYCIVYNNSVLLFNNSALLYNNSVLLYNNSVLLFNNSVLLYN